MPLFIFAFLFFLFSLFFNPLFHPLHFFFPLPCPLFSLSFFFSSFFSLLEWLWDDTPSPRAERSQQDSRHWSSICVVLEWWLNDAERLWGDILHPRAKEKPQQEGRRGEIEFRIKPHIHQRCLEGSNIPCVHQDPETETELCLDVFWGGRGQ